MIKAAIVGVSGYGGIELFHILDSHPEVIVTAVSSRTYDGKKISQVYPHLSHINATCKNYSPKEIVEISDVVFTATPHGGPSMEFALPVKNANKKLIDLSADFRLKDKSVYEKWYNVEHKCPELLNEAVYGLPELHKEEIKNAWLIANPGCYPTAAILSVAPLLKEGIADPMDIIIDSKSGASGAGRKLKENMHFAELHEGFSAYAPCTHRHTPEIEQEMSLAGGKDVSILFLPHLVPMIRGILSVSYVKDKKNISANDVLEIFKNFYEDEPFVRILEDSLPNTKYTAGTNFVDIAVRKDEKNNRFMIISSIDNLIKGASGQAVQNMNLAFGLDESLGLRFKPVYP